MNFTSAIRRLFWSGALVGLSVALAGCGSDDEEPAVCSSVDDLRTSVSAVTGVQVQQGALATLQDDLGTVKSDLSAVVEDAKDEYSEEVDAVQQAANDLSSSVEVAVASPSAAAAGAVRTAARALGSTLNALVDAVEDTC